MDKELQTYYEARFSMMGSHGWKDFMEDIDNMLEASDRIGPIKTIEELNFKRGEISILNWLKGLKGLSEAAYEELKDK